MFYEENQIDDILKCGHCQKRFDEPRILPCGDSVCNSCIQIILNSINKSNDTYQCLICKKSHVKSVFQVNKPLQKILDKSPSEVYRGETVEELKVNLNDINSRKLKLENGLKNSIEELQEHCLKIRGDVDLATEKHIQDIQDQREEIIKKINDYKEKTASPEQFK